MMSHDHRPNSHTGGRSSAPRLRDHTGSHTPGRDARFDCRRVATAASQVGDELRDTCLAEEIVLLGEVIAAAEGAGRELTQAEVDDALGLSAGAGLDLRSCSEHAD